MEQKLTARVQKLTKKPQQTSTSFASALDIEQEDMDLVEEKGRVCAVFDFTSVIPLDTLLVTKIISDVLYDAYYTSGNDSPIQALEKAIVQVKDRVIELSRKDKSQEAGLSEFNILSAVLCGNTLYMVQFGKGASFLVRDGVVKPVNSSTEGSFSVASGVVKEDDVVILATKSFVDSYKPDELVSGAISFSMSDLSDISSAILIKFDPAADVVKDSRMGSETPDSMASNTTIRQSAMTTASKSGQDAPKITLRSTKSAKSKVPTIVGFVALFLLAGSIYVTVRNGKDDKADDLLSTPEETESTESEELLGVSDEVTGGEIDVEKIKPEAFYDIKIVDENASPTDIAIQDNYIVVADKSSGKVYLSEINVPKFEEDSVFEGIDSMAYFGGDLVFVDKEGYKVYDVASGEVLDSYPGDSSGLSAYYVDYVYSIVGDSIKKYELSGEELEGSVWARSDDLNDVVSIAVDGNIYVLKDNGELLRFFGGKKDDFKVKGLNRPFLNPVEVVKDHDLEHVYVADAGNNRIVVLDEDGNVVNRLVPSTDVWRDMKGIAVMRDESKLFVLDGSKIFEVDLIK